MIILPLGRRYLPCSTLDGDYVKHPYHISAWPGLIPAHPVLALPVLAYPVTGSSSAEAPRLIWYAVGSRSWARASTWPVPGLPSELGRGHS